MSQPYRHALWLPSRAWREGYQYGAPLVEFQREFPRKVKELGPPLRVWDSPLIEEGVASERLGTQDRGRSGSALSAS